MSIRRAIRLAGMAAGVGLGAVALAQPPARPMTKPMPRPADTIPPADSPPTQTAIVPTVLKVQAATASSDGSASFPKALADARAACGKLRDYTCHLIRQERVGGTLLPEQVCELRVRTQPFAVNVRVTAPKELAGQETSYSAARSTTKVRFRAGGVEGIRHGFVTLPQDDSKLLLTTRHPISDTGLVAVLDRVARAIATEKRLNHPVTILMSEYTFAGRPVTRYEIFADRPHPGRYAHRMVLFLDKETSLPARFEAYDQPRAGGSDTGDLLEVQNFVGLKGNTGLGESSFER